MAKALGYQTVIDAIHYKERSVTVTEAVWRDTLHSRFPYIHVELARQITAAHRSYIAKNKVVHIEAVFILFVLKPFLKHIVN